MNTVTLRGTASFDFEMPLLEILKAKAKASNKSLNSYVEALLKDVVGLNRKSDNVITPELQAKIDSAREEYRKGNFVSCSTADDLRHYLNSL